jgi:hypothetical protein
MVLIVAITLAAPAVQSSMRTTDPQGVVYGQRQADSPANVTLRGPAPLPARSWTYRATNVATGRFAVSTHSSTRLTLRFQSWT